MSDPLPKKGKMLSDLREKTEAAKFAIRNNNVLFAALMLVMLGSIVRLWNAQPVFYAHAYTGGDNGIQTLDSPLFAEKKVLIDEDVKEGLVKSGLLRADGQSQSASSKELAQRIYMLVGDAPIKEMVPYISQRDEKVAAFLVGIAKKESSFGSASPSKDGQDCHNYWGYKGAGGRGTAMGYGCFSSAQEAVKIVGDRMEVLVGKERNTPARMVDTWKCGTSCKGDPGAPGWVSTVALYFEKVMSKES